MIKIGIGIDNYIYPASGGGIVIDTQAEAHYNRVIADGGTVPKGLAGCSAYFTAVKAVYGVSDITTSVAAAYDPDYLGYRLGDGSGTTSGQAAKTLYSATGATSDLAQGTAGNQPLLLVHDGVNNYWWGSGVNGNYCSTPASAQNRILGDIDIKVNLSIITGNFHTICSTGGTETNLSYLFLIRNTNVLQFEFSQSGVIKQYITTATLTSNYSGWLRVTRNSSTGQIVFYTSANGTTWTTFETISGATGSADDSNTTLGIGSFGTTLSTLGKIYRATISNSIGGAPVVSFNANDYNPSISQTYWDSATTGERWTISTDTGANYHGALVFRTMLQSDGVNDNMSIASAISPTLSEFSYYSIQKFFRASTFYISDKSTFNATLFAGTDTASYPNGSASSVATNALLNMVQLGQTSGAIPKIALNNGTIAQNGGTQTHAWAGNSLFTSQNIAAFANTLFTGFVVTKDYLTQRTALYNYLRSLNSNAF